MSLKAPLVVLWACLMAGAAIASENHRLCELNTHTELTRLQEMHRLHEDEVHASVFTEFDETN